MTSSEISNALPVRTNTSHHPEQAKVGEAQECYAQGKQFFESGDYNDAIEAFRKALKIQELVLGKYHSHTIKTYWRIGRAFCISPETYPQALSSFKRALRTAEGSFGKNDKRTVSLLDDITEQLTKFASQQHEQEDENQTQPRDCTKDLENIVTALELEREGDGFSKLRKYKQATEKYLEAIQLEELAFDGEGLDCADVKSKVACMYRLRGDMENSCFYFRQALQLYQEKVGDKHPATLGAQSNIRNIVSSAPSSQSLSHASSSSSSSSSLSFGGNPLLRFRAKKNVPEDSRRQSWLGALSSNIVRKGEVPCPPRISV